MAQSRLIHELIDQCAERDEIRAVEGVWMGRHSWSRLNKAQVGRFAEYFVKMEFALYGFEVFTSEVDDRGIDFVVRHGAGGFREIQVKSTRESNYVFMQKTK